MFACDSVVLHRKSLSFYLLDQIFCWEKTETLSNLTDLLCFEEATCCFLYFRVALLLHFTKKKWRCFIASYWLWARKILKVRGFASKKMKDVRNLFLSQRVARLRLNVRLGEILSRTRRAHTHPQRFWFFAVTSVTKEKNQSEILEKKRARYKFFTLKKSKNGRWFCCYVKIYLK